MATKLQIMKFVEEIRGYAEITDRRPIPRPAVLCLMDLHSQTQGITVPKRRLAVTVNLELGPNNPDPVKITYVRPDTLALPVVVR